MSKLSDFILISTGEVLPVGATVTRLKPNKNGNTPSGILIGTCPDGRALIRFDTGKRPNDLATFPETYGLRRVSRENS